MRLAYEQGLLSQKNPSHTQRWALLYWIYMDRRTKAEDERAFLMQQTFNLDPDRWVELGYRAEMMRMMGIEDKPEVEEGEPLTPQDEADIDQFLRQQDQIAAKRWITAGLLPPDFVPDTQGTPV